MASVGEAVAVLEAAAAERAPPAAYTLSLVQLKAANRDAYAAVAQGRTLATSAQGDVDAATTQLHTLAYERQQLEAQIAACNATESIYKSIPLRSVEAWAAQAPAAMHTEAEEGAQNQLLFRLQFELDERRRVEQETHSRQAHIDTHLREQRAVLRSLHARQAQIARVVEVRGATYQSTKRPGAP